MKAFRLSDFLRDPEIDANLLRVEAGITTGCRTLDDLQEHQTRLVRRIEEIEDREDLVAALRERLETLEAKRADLTVRRMRADAEVAVAKRC